MRDCQTNHIEQVREDLRMLEQEIAWLNRLMGVLRHDRLNEDGGIIKPLTPKQSMKRAERDRKRHQQIADIQQSAAQRVARIKGDLGH